MNKFWRNRWPDHKQFSVITSLVFLSLHFFGATGCTNVILSAGTAAVTASQEERGLATAANDLAIQANINALFLKQELYSWPAITVSVFDGRVLLTGAVTQKTDRAKAENIAKRGRGVRRVFNEIQVTNTKRNWLRDQMTTLTLKDKLLRDKSIFSINYSINAANEVVYLMGIAQTFAELKRVRAHSRNTKNVRRIVDYVVVKN